PQSAPPPPPAPVEKVAPPTRRDPPPAASRTPNTRSCSTATTSGWTRRACACPPPCGKPSAAISSAESPIMSRPFEGRVAVVTGGARGIGRGIALRFARDGADGVIAYRRGAEVAGGVVRELEREGVKARAVPLELAEPAQVPAVFERIGETFGRVDILVANAAATSFRPLAEQKEHNVRRTFAITADSFIAAVQGAVP